MVRGCPFSRLQRIVKASLPEGCLVHLLSLRLWVVCCWYWGRYVSSVSQGSQHVANRAESSLCGVSGTSNLPVYCLWTQNDIADCPLGQISLCLLPFSHPFLLLTIILFPFQVPYPTFQVAYGFHWAGKCLMNQPGLVTVLSSGHAIQTVIRQWQNAGYETVYILLLYVHARHAYKARSHLSDVQRGERCNKLLCKILWLLFINRYTPVPTQHTRTHARTRTCTHSHTHAVTHTSTLIHCAWTKWHPN